MLRQRKAVSYARLWNKLGFILTLVSILLMVTWPITAGHGAPLKQTATPRDQALLNAQALLNRLSPEEKIGQLFVVSFNGSEIGLNTPIYNLITHYSVGGVVLLAKKDNFPAGAQPQSQILALDRQIQLTRWNASQKNQAAPLIGQGALPSYIPLFICLSQEGDGYPFDQVFNGLTPLPNQMAIGATWNPALSTQVGNVLGKELSLLGINMLLGPSLDVLEAPYPESISNLGSRTFGGDPFWVGKMGKAYIQGVHQGSNGQVAVVAKHFPGHGGSDRIPEEEVATVRKSLEQLKNFELAPFFEVTGNAATPDATVDGLLTSHIRYQGFQGNIRATTRPVSLDPQAFSLLMNLPSLDTWRKNGGVIMSDDLGSKAVRRFYELTSQTFDARRVALSAFLAGNDLLYIADFTSAPELDSDTAAIRTLEFFAQKYREDTAFAQRVDESVLRILTLKYRIYPSFALSEILPSLSTISQIGKSDAITFEVARQAATLISPSQAELDDAMPDSPDLTDRVVFISDNLQVQQCSQCPPQTIFNAKSLEQVVLRRYGPQAGGQVTPGNLSSYTIDDLNNLLKKEKENFSLERDLRRANWLIFSLITNSSSSPSYSILSNFLADRPDLFQQKRLIVFAFNAPYFLDATNISKLTAYYGLYSKTAQFVDIAAYLLFRELRPLGRLPVSVPGVGYDLNTALFPDPGQVIPLEVDIPGPTAPITTTTPIPPTIPEFHMGDVIPLRTGVILDHNGHPVPDGTPVDFIITMSGVVNPLRQTTTTINGIARTSVSVTGMGQYVIRAESEPAKSKELTIDIPIPGGMESVTPTQTPTETPTVTPQPSTTPIPSQPVSPDNIPRPQLTDWLMTLLVSFLIAWSSYRLAAQNGQVRWGIRAGLLALIGGLLTYCYLALQLPGSERLLQPSIQRGVFIATLLGCSLGLLLTWVWRAASPSAE